MIWWLKCVTCARTTNHAVLNDTGYCAGRDWAEEENQRASDPFGELRHRGVRVVEVEDLGYRSVWVPGVYVLLIRAHADVIDREEIARETMRKIS